MGKPAARISDFHMCPMVTPGVPPIPHVGGPIVGPGVATVLIANMPAAVMGDSCVCTGPPDSAILGSMGVLIGGKPALRMGDSTAHGGVIMAGAPTVLIGEMSPGGPAGPVPPEVMTEIANIKKQAAAAQNKAKSIVSNVMSGQSASANASFSSSLKQAAESGSPFIHQCEQC